MISEYKLALKAELKYFLVILSNLPLIVSVWLNVLIKWCTVKYSWTNVVIDANLVCCFWNWGIAFFIIKPTKENINGINTIVINVKYKDK